MKPRFASLLMVVLLTLAPAAAAAVPIAPAEPIAPPYPPHDILASPPYAAAEAPADLEYRLPVFYVVPANVPFDPAVLERILS
jgi:hypothetical protein